jgi:hypothetical protein
MANCCLLSRLRRCARPAGPSDPGVQAGSRRDFPGSLKGARNIVRRERADDTNAQDNCHRKVEPIRRPVHSRPPPFGARFLQRNIEKLSKDRAALGQEIRESVAELFDAALESRAAIAIKGAPDQHAEGATVLRDEDGCTARSRDAPAIHHHGTSGSRAAPVTFYLPGWQSQTHWSGTVRRIGFFWRSRPSDTSRYPLTCVFVACRNLHSGNSAGHRHGVQLPLGLVR